MISITDNAIVLSARKHAESSALVEVLTEAHGVYKGIVRGAFSKNNRGLYQPGNLVSMQWSARIAEHMGSIKAEMLKPYAALIMPHQQALAQLSSACSLLAVSLPERHSYPNLYAALIHLLTHLAYAPDECMAEYIRFELLLLAETGFGLDFSQCAATGERENLIYVSPKSGRAVSAGAGEAYKDKILKLPPFLLPPRKALPPKGGGLGGGDTSPQQEENPTLISQARELRKNLTDAEKKLWHHLSHEQLEGMKFRRQHPMGDKYIVDFVCLEIKLVVELDGGQHAEQKSYDDRRTAFLEAEGYRVLRFWNNEVMENIEGVWMRIRETLLAPVISPSPLRGEGRDGGDLSSTLSSELVERTPPPNPPPFRGRASVSPADLADGLTLTGYFLEHWLFDALHRKIPAARGRVQTSPSP